jgi:hypothetical protein
MSHAHPQQFREIMVLYLETYVARVSDRYTTRRGKVIAIAHFWRFLAEKHPEVTIPRRCFHSICASISPTSWLMR